MLCERCQERDATMRIDAVATTGELLRRVILCEACAATPLPPRRIDDPDVRAVLELEASGHVVTPEVFARAAEDFVRRAAAHGDPMPPDVQAFVDRHPRTEE